MTTYTITVLGAGVVGTNLARAFTDLGHTVRIGARDVASEKVRAALSTVPGSVAMPIGDADDRTRPVEHLARIDAHLDVAREVRHLAVPAVVEPAAQLVGVVRRRRFTDAGQREPEFAAEVEDVGGGGHGGGVLSLEY